MVRELYFDLHRIYSIYIIRTFRHTYVHIIHTFINILTGILGSLGAPLANRPI